ncbi:torsin-1A-like [Saccostrea cucullata]|uniref:torsin-1A-like n=1 Tax=Saccostrea cuccullata TaxID=36930 RepID=UPI002ED4A952
MDSVKWIVFYGLFTWIPGIKSFLDIGSVGTAVLAGIYTAYKPVKCYFKECCPADWAHLDATALREDLQTRVFGQDLAIDVIMKHLRAHMTKDPTRALALSFHGGTGTGKNHVSRIIAEGLYQEGMRSKYVHFISATKEFPHVYQVPLYKDKLKELVENSVKDCERSLFIFDEIDKMPPGLIDTLTPYLDFNEHLSGTDYRKAIFLFLSNTAGKEIFHYTLEHQFSRERIGLNEMEQLISKVTVNTNSNGMYLSDVIIKHLITAFVPFLPLKRKHVKKCIKDYLVARNYNKRDSVPEEIVQKIMRELIFFPDDTQIFSVTGCKRVPDKVDYVMYDG